MPASTFIQDNARPPEFSCLFNGKYFYNIKNLKREKPARMTHQCAKDDGAGIKRNGDPLACSLINDNHCRS